ncbi:MAG: GntR family transcriptional regulator [Gammaproteobacteria bacterium]|nr:GntR family transcriptional regulator [Gammaproteobacteria bacterium]
MIDSSIEIGRYNTLRITKNVDFGVYLDGGDEETGGWGEILLPARYVPADSSIGDELEVFIYFDSEDRIIATTEKPKATVGEFAYLRAVDVNKAGAFLDWGLPKDVLVPYREQAKPMRQGAYYLVYLFQDDESERVTASSRVSQYLNQSEPTYTEGESVPIIIMATTDLGYKAIINHSHTGMLYHNEVFEPLKIGQKLTATIKKVREDGKIDLAIPSVDKKNLSELEQTIIDKLNANHGVVRLGDKTPPDEIYKAFKVSKKNFKRAVSRLYKQRLITVKDNSIHLADSAK